MGLAFLAAMMMAAAPDPLAPKSSGADAMVSPLAMVTLGVASLDETERFYGAAMGMDCRRHALRAAEAKAFRAHYTVPGEGPVRLVVCNRQGAARVRAVELGGGVAQARPGHDARLTGALSLGFPSGGNVALDKRVTGLGFSSTAGLTSITLPKADGTTYDVGEVHYRAPDGVLALGIDRGAMPAVGPIDAAAGVGGPAYSGMMVGDMAAARALFADALGLEVRRSVELSSSGPAGGLGLPAGTRFTFQQWYAPGATSGYVILMKLHENGLAAAKPMGLASRGLALWTFETKTLDAVLARAAATGVAVQRPAATVPLGDGSMGRSAILLTGDGFPVEVVERQ